MKRALALLALAFAGVVQAATYDDPWSPATEQAAEAAVAALGANVARPVSGAVHDTKPQILDVVGLGGAVGAGALAVRGEVEDLAAAKRGLGAQETDIEIHVELPADVLFDFDKADIRADAASALAQLATVIRAYKGPVRLEGHTDAKGATDYNQKLSERRAESVKLWLVQREQIPAARMTTRGFGKARPVASNDTDAGRQRNRRVEVVIRKR